jgi:Na+-translocating ferredoxin:NAD+ oxidoreductase RnfD subunit
MNTLSNNEFKWLKIIVFIIGVLLMLYGLMINWIASISFMFGLFLFYLSTMNWLHENEYRMWSKD